MSSACHEIVIFRAASGVSYQQVLTALTSVEPWLQEQSGFVRRAIRHDPQQALWIDLVEWATRAEAMAAMERMQVSPGMEVLGRVIDGSTMQMLHGDAPAVVVSA